jgi:hypothetical protein
MTTVATLCGSRTTATTITTSFETCGNVQVKDRLGCISRILKYGAEDGALPENAVIDTSAVLTGSILVPD